MTRHAAIVVFWGFTVYAFVARSVVQKIRTRDSGIRGVARDRGLVAQLAGVAMVPAWLVAGVALLLTRRAAPVGIELAGVACAVGGAVVAIASQRAMGASWRIGVRAGEQTGLVRHGPFRWARNPFFTGMATVAIGTTAARPSVVGWLAVATLIAVLSLQVRLVEEPHLLTTFGDEYRVYARATGRFVPGVGRLQR